MNNADNSMTGWEAFTGKELVEYPCGHRRWVMVGSVGWNYCQECRRAHRSDHIVVNPESNPSPRPLDEPMRKPVDVMPVWGECQI